MRRYFSKMGERDTQITRKTTTNTTDYLQRIYCNYERASKAETFTKMIIKSESSFEARTIDKTLDSIVLEVGTIPYDARPELTWKISNHIRIKEDRSI